MAHSATTFTYLHSTPGRMRIRVPAYQNDESACRWIEERLRDRSGVTHVTASALTGSVLILFDAAGMEDREVLAELQSLGLAGDLIAPAGVAPDGDRLAEIPTRVGTVIGKGFLKAALNRAIGGSPASLLLLFL